MGAIDWSDELRTSDEECRARYVKAAHAMQSGVAMKMNYSSECEPKHLRTGVNAAMVDSGALAELLIYKGLISEHEYLYAIMAGMEREVELYETELSRRLNSNITLG